MYISITSVLLWLFIIFVALPFGAVTLWLLTELLFGESETTVTKATDDEDDDNNNTVDWAACPPFPQELRDKP